MQVSLNSDVSDYNGGKLIYLTDSGIQIPSRATPGVITIHQNDIVHGVTELKSGIRYGLFFLKSG
jgi:hypothetical protein